MADHVERRDGSTRLKKNVSKLAFRGKERMMRTLGMGEETKDEIIDNYVHLVNKQQAQFHKFQRDVKIYVQSINAMKAAADNFYKSLNDVYDDAWMGKDMISSLAKTTNLLFDNLSSRINMDVTNALQQHLNQCHQMKQKVQKRGRKLVDFDGARRSYYTLKNSKKIEENKLSKAQEQMDNSRETYETLNTQLHHELPDLHDSRVVLTTDVIGTIATAEKEFFTELAEIRNKLLHVTMTIKDAYSNGDYKIQRLHSAVSQVKMSQQPTLPADGVMNSRTRSRGDSGSISDRSGEDDSTYYQPVPDNYNSGARSDGQDLTPSSAKRRPNEYVNIQIGEDGVALNGDPTAEPPTNVYDNPHDEKQSSDNDLSSQKSDLPSASSDKPKPAPRELTREEITQENQDSESDSDTATDSVRNTSNPDSLADPKQEPNPLVLAPQAATRSVPPKEEENTLPGVNPPLVAPQAVARSAPPTQEETSPHGVNPSAIAPQAVTRRVKSQSSEENTNEATNKRSSFLAVSGLSRFWSRSSSKQPATQDDTAIKTKAGFFSVMRFRKDKSSEDKSDKETAPVEQKSFTLPPPKLLSQPPPRQMRNDSSSSYEDMGPECERPMTLGQPSNIRQQPINGAPSGKSSDQEEERPVEKPVAPSSGKEADQNSDASSFAAIEGLRERDYQIDSEDQGLDEYRKSKPEELEEYVDMDVTPQHTFGDENASFEHQQDEDGGEYEDVIVYPTPAEQKLEEDQGSDNEYEDIVVGLTSIKPNSVEGDGCSNEDYERPISTKQLNQTEKNSIELVQDPDDVITEHSLTSISPNSAVTKDEALGRALVQSNDELVKGMPGSRGKASIPAYSQFDKTKKWASEKSIDSSSSLNEVQDPVLQEDLRANAFTKQQAKIGATGPINASKTEPGLSPDDQNRLRTDSENEVVISSYHSSQMGSGRSSVTLSDDAVEVAAPDATAQPNLQQKLGAPEINASSSHESSDVYSFAEDLKSDPQKPKPRERILQYENASIVNQQSSSQFPNNPEADDVCVMIEEDRPNSKDSPGSAIEEDDFEDSVYDTIIITPPAAAIQDSQAIYDLPNHDPTPSSAAQTEDSLKTTQEILPPHFLYKAVAIYPYQSTDDDELSFSKGDTIYVVEYPDPEEQDEGWQMGILKSTWEDTKSTAGMGVFPENFTRRL